MIVSYLELPQKEVYVLVSKSQVESQCIRYVEPVALLLSFYVMTHVTVNHAHMSKGSHSNAY